jgi:PAS domain S-box-containing protein
MTNRAVRLMIGLGSGSAAALLANYCAFRSHLNLSAAGFIDLLIVFLTALKFGFWEATGSSFAAVASLDFFFAPPIHSFRLYDPENWVALVTFEIIALIVSRFSNQLRNEGEAAHRDEKELRDLLETMPAIAFVARPDGFNEFQSQGWLEYSGLSAESSLGYGWTSAIYPIDLDPQMSKWEASKVSGEPLEVEARHRNANGEYRWFLTRAVPLRDEQGKILKWYGVLTDIDDRKRAECLLAGEKRILEMVAKGDSLGQILENLCRLVEEQAGGSLASIALPEGDHLRRGGAPSLPVAFIDALDGSANGPLASFCATAACRGEQVIVEDIAADPLWANYCDLALQFSLRACWSTPVFSSQGRVIATLTMYFRERRRPSLRDQELIKQITYTAQVVIERKLIQEALRRSEGYLAEAQRLTLTGSWAYDTSIGQTTYWSEELFRIFGLDPQQGLPTNQTFWERIHPEDRDEVQGGIRKALREKAESIIDYRILLPAGTLKHIHSVTHAVVGRSGEVVELVGTAVDVTDRKQAEEVLRRSESHLAQAQRLTHTGSWARGTNGDIYWSEEMFRLFGFDLMQRPPDRDTVLQRVHPEDRDKARENGDKAMRDGTGIDHEYRIILSDGTVKYIHAVGCPAYSASGEMVEMVGTVMDVTERKRAQEERERLRQLEANLAHMNRVSVMGEMSASLAHELKQPMAAAMMNAEVCLELVQRNRIDIQEFSDATLAILRSVKRAAEITERLRSLSRKANPQQELVDINQAIREICALLQNEARMSLVTVRMELAREAPQVTGDRVQLQQVVLNLMLNALESMRETGGSLVLRSELTKTRDVMVSVSDTGVGLPAGNEERIFDAFFTTKSQGTGMGLAISRTIVESHGGRLFARGNVGPGATFCIELPQQIGR